MRTNASFPPVRGLCQRNRSGLWAVTRKREKEREGEREVQRDGGNERNCCGEEMRILESTSVIKGS